MMGALNAFYYYKMIHTYLPEFLNLFMMNFLNILSPGPETALMIHNSSHYSRKIGLMTGLGIVCSTLIHKTYSFLGFGAFIAQSPLLFNFVKYAGSVYLAYLGARMFFSKAKLGGGEESKYITRLKVLNPKRAFRMGFMIDILHPSASLVFITIVAATVSPSTPLEIQLSYGVLLVLTSLTWYSALALVFSHKLIKMFLNKTGLWINRAMGLYMLYFAYKLALKTLT